MLNLLILSPRTPFSCLLEKRLSDYGIYAATVHLELLTQLDLFIELLSCYPYVAALDKERLSFFLNNLQFQKGLRHAEKEGLPRPDVWVQFGSKLELMRQSGLGAERVADQIVQELMDDHRLISERKEDAVI